MKLIFSRPIAALLIILMLVGVLTGCGGNSEDNNNNNGNNEPNKAYFVMAASNAQQQANIGENFSYDIIVTPATGEAYKDLAGTLNINTNEEVFVAKLLDDKGDELYSSTDSDQRSNVDIDFTLKGGGPHRYKLNVFIPDDDDLLDKELNVELRFRSSDASNLNIVAVQPETIMISAAEAESGTDGTSGVEFPELNYSLIQSDEFVQVSTASAIVTLPYLGDKKVLIIGLKVKNLYERDNGREVKINYEEDSVNMVMTNLNYTKNPGSDRSGNSCGQLCTNDILLGENDGSTTIIGFQWNETATEGAYFFLTCEFPGDIIDLERRTYVDGDFVEISGSGV